MPNSFYSSMPFNLGFLLFVTFLWYVLVFQVTQYIGETCRYLLAQPVKPSDKDHKLRVAIGNGLRPQIWKEFQTRFNIKQIGEFYGSTEGNAHVINLDNKEGSVGFNSVLAPDIFPSRLFRIDEETGEILRDSNGLAIPCKYNEPGEMIGKVISGMLIDFGEICRMETFVD